MSTATSDGEDAKAPARSLSQEALELAEYRLLEKVQEKLIARGKFAFGVFAAGLTLLGLIGGSAIVNSISNSVEKDVSAKLEKDAAVLNERLRKTLADLQVSGAEIQKATADARARLDAASTEISKLTELSEKYARLSADLEGLNKKIASAVEISNEARKDTKDLRQATLAAVAGRPSIIGSSFAWGRPDGKNEVQGTNFGDRPGKVSVRLYVSNTEIERLNPGKGKQAYSEWLSVDAPSIQSWSNTLIALSPSAELIKRVDSAERQLKEKGTKAKADYFGYEYKVETRSGESTQMN